MSERIKEKITCCNCNKKRIDYGHGLCQACYKKFKAGKIVHPLGSPFVQRKGRGVTPPLARVKADSDVSTLCDHNPHDLPFWVEEQPADPNQDPFAWWEAA